MLIFALSLLAAAPNECDVALSGPSAMVQPLASELEGYGLSVGTDPECSKTVVIEMKKGKWRLRRVRGGGLPMIRTVSNPSEAAFTIAGWMFEDAAAPLIHPPVEERESGSGTPPKVPTDEAPPSDRRAEPAQGELRTSTPRPPTPPRSPWSIQPLAWAGVDDAAAAWVGGGLKLGYRWSHQWDLFVLTRAGTSGEARANDVATATRRTTVDLLVGGGRTFAWNRVRLNPRVAVGVGALWAHREDGSGCLQPGTCAADTQLIPDDFNAVEWVPKADATITLGLLVGAGFWLNLDLGATLAPSADLYPEYVEGRPDQVRERTALEGTPAVIGHGGLGLAVELP